MRIPLNTTNLRLHLNEGVTKAIAWLSREFAGLVPDRLREFLAFDAARIVVSMDDDGNVFMQALRRRLGRRTHVRALFRGPLEDLPVYLGRNRFRLGRAWPVFLRVPIEQCLVREIRVPTAALGHLPQILAIDLERATPFKVADVLSGHTVGPLPSVKGHASVQHILLKRSAVTGLLGVFATAGVQLSGAEVIDQPYGQVPRALLTSNGGKPELPPTQRSLRRLILALAMACILAGAGNLMLANHKAEQRLAAVRQEISTLQKQASVVRRQLESRQRRQGELTGPRSRKLRDFTVMSVIEELSRALPDQAFITELQLADGSLVIDGLARSAADLVGLLSASAMIKEASFVAPVTRDPVRGLERFRIKLLLDAPGSAK